jgi:hypothetical protein
MTSFVYYTQNLRDLLVGVAHLAADGRHFLQRIGNNTTISARLRREPALRPHSNAEKMGQWDAKSVRNV